MPKIIREDINPVEFSGVQIGELFLHEYGKTPYIKIGKHSDSPNCFRLTPASVFTLKHDTQVFPVDSEIKIKEYSY